MILNSDGSLDYTSFIDEDEEATKIIKLKRQAEKLEKLAALKNQPKLKEQAKKLRKQAEDLEYQKALEELAKSNNPQSRELAYLELLRRAGGTLLLEVEKKEVTWLWKDFIPLGKLTVIDGDPGVGKSLFTVDLAARVTRGWLMPPINPTGKEDRGKWVIFMSAEDDPADTIKPRLEAAGGDSSKVLLLKEKNGKLLSIPEDIDAIKEVIELSKAKLLIIDPLMAWLSPNVNSHRDQDVRGALHQLGKLAEETGVSIVIVRHLNKTGGTNPLYRGGGSIGIIGAARAGFVIAKDPDNDQQRVLAPTKTNLAKQCSSLAFHIEERDGVPVIKWDGLSEYNAEALLVPSDKEETGALAEAKKFLKVILTEGEKEAEVIYKEAKGAGISERTLKRAKKALSIESYRKGGLGEAGVWVWALPKPPKSAKSAKSANNLNLALLGDDDKEDNDISAGKSTNKAENTKSANAKSANDDLALLGADNFDPTDPANWCDHCREPYKNLRSIATNAGIAYLCPACHKKEKEEKEGEITL